MRASEAKSERNYVLKRSNTASCYTIITMTIQRSKKYNTVIKIACMYIGKSSIIL